MFGHRGVRNIRPENTLAALEEAARAGADGVEVDARLCASGEVVVLHDPTLARVTGGADARPVHALRWTELARVDVGDGERPPRLADVLAFCRERHLRLNVEVKHDVPSRKDLAAAVGRLLRTWDRAHPVLLSSFDPRTLLELRRAVPERPRAQIVHRSRYHDVALRFARAGLAEGVNLERTIASPERARALAARGLFVGVWTVNDVREARDLAELGADAIITDDPAAILRELEQPQRDSTISPGA